MSHKSSKSTFSLVGMGLALGLIAGSFAYTSYVQEKSTINNLSRKPAGENTVSNSDINSQEALTAIKVATSKMNVEALKSEWIQKLREKYGHMIHDIVTQVQLKSDSNELLKLYPQQGRALFGSIVDGAFPKLSAQVLKAVSSMLIYDRWLLDNTLIINKMDLAKQNTELWKKRESLFGEDAKRIWSDKISFEEERRVTLEEAVGLLDSSYDTNMYERIAILQTAFKAQYDETMDWDAFDSTGILSKMLFGFDSVQQELAALSNEQRQIEIDSIRRSIGFNELSINKKSQQDQKRERRWQKGYLYMAERSELMLNSSDEVLTEALYKLQTRYFRHEAPTIAKEEREGIMRFDIPRVYGLN